MSQQQTISKAGATPPKRRIEAIDVAKGIGILSIIVGHLAAEASYNTQRIVAFVFLYHVPIFFLIAGYFLSVKRPFGQFVKSKAQRLLYPFAFASAVMFLVVLLLLGMRGHCLPPTIYRSPLDAFEAGLLGYGAPQGSMFPQVTWIGAIWFLEALFWSLLAGYGILKLEALMLEGVPQWLTMGLLLLATFGVAYGAHALLPIIGLLPLNISTALFSLFYLYLGHVLRRFNFFAKDMNVFLFLTFLAISAVMYHFRYFVNMVIDDADPHWLGFFAALPATLAVMQISRYLVHFVRPVANLLTFFGRNSLIFLVVHILLINLGGTYLLYRVVPFIMPNVLSFYLLIIIHLTAGTLVSLLNDRWKPLQKIFGVPVKLSQERRVTAVVKQSV
ncbi:MAG: acyltransferase [Bifidobacteriaceae bacterium]|nr:acyltransferase [Bifidobacteriaceae bacterium]